MIGNQTDNNHFGDYIFYVYLPIIPITDTRNKTSCPYNHATSKLGKM